MTKADYERECWEGLHSLSCSEGEDRGELVCTGCLIHLAVWTMRKDFHLIFSPYNAEMQSCADTEWNMSIMGWVWLLVPFI